MKKILFLPIALIVILFSGCESKKQTEVPVVKAPTYREVTVVCSSCRGTGQQKCKKCDGSGKVYGFNNNIIDCDKCEGYGFFVCSICGGNGKVIVKQEIDNSGNLIKKQEIDNSAGVPDADETVVK